MGGKRTTQAGMTLIELLVAVAIGAMVLAGLNSVVSLGLKAQLAGRQRNELVYQARFALERMITTARGAPPKLLATPTAGTTGNWFSPAMYCLNGSGRLIETTTADTGCTGATAIAGNVSAFSAALPAGAGVVNEPVATLNLTLVDSAAPQTVSLSTSVRLGGGTL
jgi:prepilin-type N-terminal cleavage/methylation domain-containing protein